MVRVNVKILLVAACATAFGTAAIAQPTSQNEDAFATCVNICTKPAANTNQLRDRTEADAVPAATTYCQAIMDKSMAAYQRGALPSVIEDVRRRMLTQRDRCIQEQTEYGAQRITRDAETERRRLADARNSNCQLECRRKQEE